MADKGKLMSQTYHERQSKLIDLYQEAVCRNDIDENQAITALRMIGFSEAIASIRVREWTSAATTVKPETERTKKFRLKKQASLEKYVLQMRLGKKYYLRLKLKRKEISRNEAVKKLIQYGYTEEIAKETVKFWETEK